MVVPAHAGSCNLPNANLPGLPDARVPSLRSGDIEGAGRAPADAQCMIGAHRDTSRRFPSLLPQETLASIQEQAAALTSEVDGLRADVTSKEASLKECQSQSKTAQESAAGLSGSIKVGNVIEYLQLHVMVASLAHQGFEVALLHCRLSPSQVLEGAKAKAENAAAKCEADAKGAQAELQRLKARNLQQRASPPDACLIARRPSAKPPCSPLALLRSCAQKKVASLEEQLVTLERKAASAATFSVHCTCPLPPGSWRPALPGTCRCPDAPPSDSTGAGRAAWKRPRDFTLVLCLPTQHPSPVDGLNQVALRVARTLGSPPCAREKRKEERER